MQTNLFKRAQKSTYTSLHGERALLEQVSKLHETLPSARVDIRPRCIHASGGFSSKPKVPTTRTLLP